MHLQSLGDGLDYLSGGTKCATDEIVARIGFIFDNYLKPVQIKVECNQPNGMRQRAQSK
jgi:hypothetical protein